MSNTVKTLVFKASLPMMSGEDVQTFSSELRDAGKAAHPNSDWLWAVQITANTVVFSDVDNDSSKMVMHSYTRDLTTGEFSLGDPVEVEQRMTFVPVS